MLAGALNHGRASVQAALDANHAAVKARRRSPRMHNPEVKAAVACIEASLGQRASGYEVRAAKQAALLNLPAYPTTTIGSFPQTAEIRQARSQFRSGALDEAAYKQLILANNWTATPSARSAGCNRMVRAV